MDSTQFLIRTLVAEGTVAQADVTAAEAHTAREGGDVLGSLAALGLASARRLAIARAKICEYPFVDLGVFDVDIANTRLFPRQAAEKLVAFPLFICDGVATVAMLDPLNLQGIDQARQLLKLDVDPVLCEPDQLRALIARAYSIARTHDGDEAASAPDGEEDLTTGEEPIVAAVNQIITGAVDAGASDIHINPDERDLLLRYRVDGVLLAQRAPAKSAQGPLVQRLKVLAKLDLTQTRRPQDGKFRFIHRGQAVDIRLSLMPTIHGENAVMRLLRAGSSIGKIESLEMPADIAGWYAKLIESPHGMILVTGPTGSGKTTTLYTALAAINSPELNIMTIEDPVEIRLPMIRQVQINAEVGMTFASALRSMLRQDPDVVLVGEIRDQETAKIAVQAAMTGHLVFSTLHTNDAVGAVARLRDLGLPPFAINNGLLCAMAQRLVRRVCDQCAAPDRSDAAALSAMGIDPGLAGRFRVGVGCPRCASTGYRGRLGAYEMLRVSTTIQGLIERDASVGEIGAAARAGGMRSMWEDGLEKATRGLTSVRELMTLRSVLESAGEPGELRLSA